MCELKRNGVHRSELVVLGYTWTPGVDHQDNFSGMVHDVTLRIGLMNWTVRNLDVGQMDVETAFLEGTLKESERTHMNCLPGMNLEKDECLKIWNRMCGLVQSAKVSISPEIGFQRVRQINACL